MTYNDLLPLSSVWLHVSVEESTATTAAIRDDAVLGLYWIHVHGHLRVRHALVGAARALSCSEREV